MDLSRRGLLLSGIALGAAVLPRIDGALAQSGRIYVDGGFAMGGTDPVAYFEEGRPRAGSEAHKAEWNGAVWLFASAENRARFVASPERFAPQYGGWCAWAAARGYAASTTPEAWAIVDGKLYLNYSRRIHRRWEGDRDAEISRADANWPDIF